MAQFIIMPLLGLSLARASGFPAEIAAGIILIGCSTSGLASNVMSYLAKANLALSITIKSTRLMRLNG
jgi:bile acid:Na+ symporter, BASS family